MGSIPTQSAVKGSRETIAVSCIADHLSLISLIWLWDPRLSLCWCRSFVLGAVTIDRNAAKDAWENWGLRASQVPGQLLREGTEPFSQDCVMTRTAASPVSWSYDPDMELRAFTSVWLKTTLAHGSMVVLLLHCSQCQDCTCRKFSLEFPTEKALYNEHRGHPKQIDGYTNGSWC